MAASRGAIREGRFDSGCAWILRETCFDPAGSGSNCGARLSLAPCRAGAGPFVLFGLAHRVDQLLLWIARSGP